MGGLPRRENQGLTSPKGGEDPSPEGEGGFLLAEASKRAVR